MAWYRSFSGGQDFSDDERATSELYRYGSVIIRGAGADLTINSTLATGIREEYCKAGEEATKNNFGRIPIDHRLECMKKEVFLNEVSDPLQTQLETNWARQ
jgi:hypothetical protein